MSPKLFKEQPNTVILTIIVVDFFVNGAWGLIGPFFAIFVMEQIVGGSAVVVGFATAIFWVVKSVLQIPISRWLDRTDGEHDEFWAFFLGYLALGVIPIMYFFSTSAWHIYVTEVFHGVILAWSTPAWYSIFTRHIDRGHISFDWSLWSTVSLGFAATIAAVLGGLLVVSLGFSSIFLIVSGIIFASAYVLFPIRKRMSSTPHPRAQIVLRKHVR